MRKALLVMVCLAAPTGCTGEDPPDHSPRPTGGEAKSSAARGVTSEEPRRYSGRTRANEESRATEPPPACVQPPKGAPAAPTSDRRSHCARSESCRRLQLVRGGADCP